MPLVGDLKHTRLPRLLEVLAAGRKTGVLRAKSGRTTLTAHVRAGHLQCAWLSDWPEPVVSLVSQHAPPEHRESVRALARGSDVGAALLLEFSGYVGPGQVLADAREKGIEALCLASAWQKGDVRYEDGPSLGQDRLDLNLGMTPLVNRLAKGA